MSEITDAEVREQIKAARRALLPKWMDDPTGHAISDIRPISNEVVSVARALVNHGMERAAGICEKNDAGTYWASRVLAAAIRKAIP